MLVPNNKLLNVKIENGLNENRTIMRYGFLKDIICVKKRIMHYITEFELDLIISNSYWKVVRQIEGDFDSSNAICTVSQ